MKPQPADVMREIIFQRIEPIPATGCWVWMMYCHKAGYGGIDIGCKHHFAHRVSYEAYKGAIPKGLEIDHLCKVRSCVNPDHLEAVTHAENMRRNDRTNLGKYLRDRTHCKNGHEYKEGSFWWTTRKTRRCKQCERDRYYKKRAQYNPLNVYSENPHKNHHKKDI